MKFVATLLFASLLFAVRPDTLLAQSHQKPEKLAQKSAEAWLALTDSGKYTDSWQEASASVKAGVSPDAWFKTLTTVRSPLGKVLSRKLQNATYTKSVPFEPEGEYVILKYETRFAHRKHAVETITPTLDKDGKWRVSAYFIK